jgi:hypothetical protein
MPDDTIEVSVMVQLIKRMSDTKVVSGEKNAGRTKRFEIHIADPGDFLSLVDLEKCVGQLMIITGPVHFEPPPPRQEDEE